MNYAIYSIIAIIISIHIYILWLEMFAWETAGKKAFKSIPADLFPKTKVMAANQGLYNGFLAAGLLWTFFIENIEWKNNVALFFLGCVFVAGTYGALTASKKIFFIQSLPALVGIILIVVKVYFIN